MVAILTIKFKADYYWKMKGALYAAAETAVGPLSYGISQVGPPA